jgi:transaldolase
MTITPRIKALAALRQSVWLDDLSRPLIDGGDLQELIEAGVTGVTSNPTIFARALAESAYDERAAALAGERFSADVLERLMAQDIADACDHLLPVWEATGGSDGYVSWEVNPAVADDWRGNVAEASRLRAAVPHPNLLIKIPATTAGIEAFKTLVSEGYSVNVTLIFSVEQYAAVNDAYMAGLEELIANGGNPAGIHSVASMFVSRLDTAADGHLDRNDSPAARALHGALGIAEARLAYSHFRRSVASPRWKALASTGANPQRCLWASTTMRDPTRRDVEYVEALIGPDTVTTVAGPILEAFLDHGRVATTLTADVEEARSVVEQFDRLGIDPHEIASELQRDGVQRFIKSYWDAAHEIGIRTARPAQEASG